MMGEAFRALRFRNYKLFFIGQTLSLIGSWMETVAMSWLVYRITGSEVLLGTVAFCSQFPMFCVSPFAGVITDRLDRRKLLMITQILYAITSAVLAVLILTGYIQVWHIVCTSIVVGTIGAFDMPARQAFVPEIVEQREYLSNAIALNSTQFNIARLLGPAVAGLAINKLGEGWCFAINAASFLAVIGALGMMKVEPRHHNLLEGKVWAQLKEGARYCLHSTPIRALLQLMAIMSLVAGAYSVLLPVFAKEVYHGDSQTLGILYSAVAVGALVAALRLAARQSVVGLGRWIVLSSLTFAVFVAFFGISPNIYIGVACLVVMGFGTMTHMGSTNTLIQTIVQDHMRGRIMAFYAMSFVGTMPIGSFLAGLSSEQIGRAFAGSGDKFIGPQATMVIASVIGLIAVALFYRSLPEFRRVLRPIYEEKGLLEPVT